MLLGPGPAQARPGQARPGQARPAHTRPSLGPSPVMYLPTCEVSISRFNIFVFFQMMVLLAVTLLARSCSCAKHTPIHLYRLCVNVCNRNFTTCMRGCRESRVKQCQSKLKKCTEKCRRKCHVVSV